MHGSNTPWTIRRCVAWNTDHSIVRQYPIYSVVADGGSTEMVTAAIRSRFPDATVELRRSGGPWHWRVQIKEASIRPHEGQDYEAFLRSVVPDAITSAVQGATGLYMNPEQAERLASSPRVFVRAQWEGNGFLVMPTDPTALQAIDTGNGRYFNGLVETRSARHGGMTVNTADPRDLLTAVNAMSATQSWKSWWFYALDMTDGETFVILQGCRG